MQIEVNNELLNIEKDTSLADFIQSYQKSGNFAVALNMEFVPRSLYVETVLKENDKLEIVEPMQGG